MILAYDYPLLGVLWSMLWFFMFFIWLMTLFYVFADIFRARELGGFAKAMWLIFVILLPLLGVLVYLLARGDKMAARQVAEAKEQEAAFASYVRQTAGAAGPADQLAQLASLRDSGAITAEEFEAGKRKVLG